MSIKVFFGKFVSRYLLLHLLAMVLVVIGLCVGVKYGLNAYTHHGEDVIVPELTGVDYRRAVALLDEQKLLVAVTDSGHNKALPAGCVLTQLPVGGSAVKEGRTVYVTINSSAMPTVKIPDIIDNSSYREAQARLASLGFIMQAPKYIDGERDWVYGIEHQGRSLQMGDKVPIESRLTLVIGNGYEEDEAPDDMMLDAPEANEDEESDDFQEVTMPAE